MASKQKNVFQKIWSFFISIKLTIFLLIILSVVCIIGTVVPQNDSPGNYAQLYSPSTYNFIKTAGFDDMYHAWWFTFLLSAFTLNLIACSTNRFSAVFKRLTQTKPILDDDAEKSIQCIKKITFKNHGPEKVKKLEEAIGHFLKKPILTQNAGVSHYFAEKGRWSHLAFYMTHLGMIAIIAGAMLGRFGFQGYMQIFEGETTDTVYIRKPQSAKKLDFSIRCDKFEVTYYDKTQRPKDYKSILTVIEDGKEVLTKIIEVNDPLIYKGIFFYQSSYGTGPGNNAKVHLKVTEISSGKSHEHDAAVGQSFTIDGTKDRVRVNKLVPDFALDQQGKVFSRSDQIKNPAVNLTVIPEKAEPYSFWIFANYPDFHKKPDQLYNVSFVNVHPTYYTGLQVTRDPGVWTVWIGCILLTLGTYLAFFTSHRRVWLKIEEKDGSMQAVLAGSGNKNKQAFKDEFEKLFTEVKSIGKM